MDDTILYLFMEFASKVKEANDTKELESITEHTYKNLRNVLDFHRELLRRTTNKMYPVDIVLQEDNQIIFSKLCSNV